MAISALLYAGLALLALGSVSLVYSPRFLGIARFILPGSSLLRVTWLSAIAGRAEGER